MSPGSFVCVYKPSPSRDQGHIESLKVARVHATCIDGEVLSVTKIRIQTFT